MKGDMIVTINVATLRSMTDEQFHALRDHVLADGLWENARGCLIRGGDYISVEPLDGDAKSMIYLGIEKDGYTHS